MKRNKNGFFKLVTKNIASGTNHKSMMIDFDGLNDYFANIGKSLDSASNCSNLEEMIRPKSTDETDFFYPMDANQVYNLKKKFKTTNSSRLDGLSNKLL